MLVENVSFKRYRFRIIYQGRLSFKVGCYYSFLQSFFNTQIFVFFNIVASSRSRVSCFDFIRFRLLSRICFVVGGTQVQFGSRFMRERVFGLRRTSREGNWIFLLGCWFQLFVSRLFGWGFLVFFVFRFLLGYCFCVILVFFL